MWKRKEMWKNCFDMWLYHMLSSKLEEDTNRHFFWQYLNWNQFENQISQSHR